jgi:hypothetical protein
MEITAHEPQAKLELEHLAECVLAEHKLVTALAGEMVAGRGSRSAPPDTRSARDVTRVLHGRSVATT